MGVVINIISSCSNVGKTTLIEGIIKELRKKGHSISTIKHDIHGFDIDKEGKDTWRHRKAGAETVLIASKKRMAVIKELEEEIPIEELVKKVEDSDFIIIEGYKKSNYKKIEIFRKGISDKIITPKEKLIAIASDENIFIEDIPTIDINNYSKLAELIESLKDNKNFYN